jgi:hypothetical protein
MTQLVQKVYTTDRYVPIALIYYEVRSLKVNELP